LNAAANHGFIARSGLTTFDEIVAAQQNIWNVSISSVLRPRSVLTRIQVGYDLAVFLATLGVAADGDIVTERVSIGGDATAWTSPTGGALGKEGGLITHDTCVSRLEFQPGFLTERACRFEGDTSLTRNDYYLANGDNHSFNGTLFQSMIDTASSTSSPSAPCVSPEQPMCPHLT
jgi:hypothetical protein